MANSIQWVAEATEVKGRILWNLEVQNVQEAQGVVPLNVPEGETYATSYVLARLPEENKRLGQVSYAAIISNQPSYHVEFRARTKDGQTVWIAEDVTVLCIGTGKWKLSGVGTDISHLRRAEAEVQEHEFRYRSLYDANPPPIWAWDAESLQILAVNSAALDFYGYSREEFVTLTIRDLLVLDDRPSFDACVVNVGFTSSSQTYWRHLKRDGTVIHVSLRSRDTQRSGAFAKRIRITIGEDITEIVELRRRAEDSARALERAQALAGMGSWSYDAETGHYFVTDPFYRLLGLVPRESGYSCEEVQERIHPEHRWLFRYSEDVSVQPGTNEASIIVSRPDGEIRNAFCRVQVYVSQSGSIRRVEGVLQDTTEAVRSEREHRQQAAFLEAVLNSGNQAILAVDSAGTCIYRNAHFDSMFGIEGQYSDHASVFHLMQTARSAFQEPDLVDQRFADQLDSDCLVARDDLPLMNGRVIERYTSPIVSPEGTLYGRLWLCRDISERVRMAEDLQRQTDNLKRIQAMAKVGSWSLDVATGQFGASDEIFRIADLPVGGNDVTLQTYASFFHPEDRGKLQLQELLSNPTAVGEDKEIRIIRRSEEVRYVKSTIHAERDSSGNAVRIDGSFFDITDLKQVEIELRWKSAFLEALINTSTDGILVTDQDWNVLYENETFHEMWHVTPEVEALNDRLQQYAFLIDQVVDSQGINQLVEYLMATSSKSVDIELTRKDGKTYEFFSAPVIGNEDFRFGRIWTFRDITERKLAEKELERRVDERTSQLLAAKLEADEANRAKSEFLSRMSHELRTPLNSILGFGQLLEMHDLPQEAAEEVAYILKAGRHLLDLINEVLDIARVESGRVSLLVSKFNVKDALIDAMSMLAPLAEECQVCVHLIESVCDELEAETDAQRFRQVIINLVSNAIKYNRIGGQVTLEYRKVDESLVEIKVSDTGPGIADHDLQRLFVPFERLGAAHSHIEGTGLGLSLSRRMAEAIGGSIRVQSQIGVGSTFVLTLPIRARSLENDFEQPSAPTHAEGNQGFKVLCVEDDPTNLRLIEMIVRQRPGVELIPAAKGSIGLELAEKIQPNLVLMDSILPDMDGIELLTQFRALKRTKYVPIVVTTSDTSDNLAQRITASGASHIVFKPINLEEFLSLIDRYIGREPSPAQ